MGVIDGRVAVPVPAVVAPSEVTCMVVVGKVLINALDFGRLLGMAQGLAQRVMRCRQPGRQQWQKRR